MLRDVGLKVAGTGLPVVGRVSDAARQEDELVGLDRRKDTVFGVATDHPQAINQHSDKEIRLSHNLTVLSCYQSTIDESRQGLHGVGGP